MNLAKYIRCGIVFLILPFLLTGCASPRTPSPKCTVLFEDNPLLFFPEQIYEVKRLEDLSLTVGVPHGERISSVNYEDYTISAKTGESLSYDYYTLTLHQIRYPALIRLTTGAAYSTTYHIGDGSGATTYDKGSLGDSGYAKGSLGNSDYADGSLGDSITIQEESPHLRFNTLAYKEQFTREGYLPVGWNTKPDGSGTSTGFGSRIDHRDVRHLDLYVEWLPCTNQSAFSYLLSGGEATITDYHGTGDIVIPPVIDGCPVTAIAANAFGDVTANRLALPASLKTVEPHAFGRITVHDFYFYDNILSLPEEAFDHYQITRLHINAVLDPVYSGSYFDTLSDKVDYLYSLKDQNKIVLFCGSSARFGYDSPALEAAFSGYRVANMGVYAYSNMLPQAKILLSYMKEGDILLSSPELDAIDNQFCGETDLDKETFCMMESNYDMLTLLDCREYTGIFAAFEEYGLSRRDMSPRSYLDSPSYYDEEGTPQKDFTYNRWGDYILFRENNESHRLFGVKRAFYNAEHIREQDLDGMNAVYDAFTEQGVRVFFTYSPRSKASISSDSTPQTILALEEMLRERLHAPVISSIQDSLMEPYYFYGTDNHLSTEGVRLHTQQVIEDLRAALELK